ncbi:hypothetical protein [[Actinomadura] parvosata]|uniref:hypothetical protein n=1 Tax=[Actinomadura] parvosata TaxID=1955412 RepID=UPI0016455F43
MNGNVKRAAIAGAALTAVLSITGAGIESAQFSGYDNMFPTANTQWKCKDGELKGPHPNFCQTDNRTLTVFRRKSLRSDGWMGVSL